MKKGCKRPPPGTECCRCASEEGLVYFKKDWWCPDHLNQDEDDAMTKDHNSTGTSNLGSAQEGS